MNCHHYTITGSIFIVKNVSDIYVVSSAGQPLPFLPVRMLWHSTTQVWELVIIIVIVIIIKIIKSLIKPKFALAANVLSVYRLYSCHDKWYCVTLAVVWRHKVSSVHSRRWREVCHRWQSRLAERKRWSESHRQELTLTAHSSQEDL